MRAGRLVTAITRDINGSGYLYRIELHFDSTITGVGSLKI